MARFCIERPRLTSVKQPDCWMKMRRIASGLPRLNSRHHCVSGSTIATVPRFFVQRGISRVPFSCALRPDDCAMAGCATTAIADAASASLINPFIISPHPTIDRESGTPARPHGMLFIIATSGDKLNDRIAPAHE